MNNKAMFVIVFACVCGLACADYAPAKVSYPKSYPESVQLPEYGEAAAAALTNVAGAKASAAKIDYVNYDEFNRYGLETGVPLLAKEYGQLTNLYAASLPPRSFVGVIEPGFHKGKYGKPVFYTGGSVGAAVI